MIGTKLCLEDKYHDQHLFTVKDISYEINDKYSFDFTKNYHTTEFFLNKMLYLLENNYESDVKNLLEKGNF